MMSDSIVTAYIKTPLGTCKIQGDDNGITVVSILDDDFPESINISKNLQNCAQQLQEYFNSERTDFQLKINPKGTSFQKKVWESLKDVPYGNTTTYLKQARLLGDEKAIRAVATANGRNPLWVILPCHRIVGTDGSLTGYAGGLWRKKWLLEHEQGCEQQSLF